MRILLVHSIYQHSGGEERAVEIELKSLKTAGATVRILTRHTPEVVPLTQKLKITAGLFRAQDATTELQEVIDSFDPHVIHFHNIMPHWGYGSVAAALQWALRKGRKVVSTIHNQRWVCANGLFLRNHQHCQQCLDRSNPLWGGIFNCRSNVAESWTYSLAISWSWMKGLYNHPSHTLIALNEITAERLKLAFPVARVEILPNPIFIATPAERKAPDLPMWTGRRLAVIGRLSSEKGVSKLILQLLGPTTEGPDVVHDPSTQFIFAGSGPLKEEVMTAAKKSCRVLYLGHLSENEVQGLIQTADGLFLSSIVEEQSPTALRTAVAFGKPIYNWEGRLSRKALTRWGDILTPEQWSQKLLGLFASNSPVTRGHS